MHITCSLYIAAVVKTSIEMSKVSLTQINEEVHYENLQTFFILPASGELSGLFKTFSSLMWSGKLRYILTDDGHFHTYHGLLLMFLHYLSWCWNLLLRLLLGLLRRNLRSCDANQISLLNVHFVIHARSVRRLLGYCSWHWTVRSFVLLCTWWNNSS